MPIFEASTKLMPRERMGELTFSPAEVSHEKSPLCITHILPLGGNFQMS